MIRLKNLVFASDFKKVFPIGSPLSTGKAAEKEQKLFESAVSGRVFLIPAALRNTKESAGGGQETGCPFFWFVFFGASKENEHVNRSFSLMNEIRC